jgi:hypothetical protein
MRSPYAQYRASNLSNHVTDGQRCTKLAPEREGQLNGGVQVSPDTGPKMAIKTTSIAPVASELHSSAMPTFPPESCSAMMPEPTMAERWKAVPRPQQ